MTIFSDVYVVMHWMQLLSWLTHVRQRRSYAQISSDKSVCPPILIIMIADNFVLTFHHHSPHGHNHPKWLNGKWWLSYKSSFPTLCSQLLPACLTPESHGTFEIISTGLKYLITLNTYLIFATLTKHQKVMEHWGLYEKALNHYITFATFLEKTPESHRNDQVNSGCIHSLSLQHVRFKMISEMVIQLW